jgi:aldehyde dehydrogenase (NAD+)
MNEIADILKSMDYGPAPEEDSHVRSWLASHKAGFGHFINGKFTSLAKSKTFKISNPANGEALGEASIGSAKDVDNAVSAAAAAFKRWSALTGNQRARHLYGLARLVQKHARFLSVLETIDNGKSIRETRDIDIPLVARHFYHHAGWAELRDEQFPGHVPAGVHGISRC